MVSWIYETLASVGYTHPLHPVIGHLPLGLIIAAFILEGYGLLFKRPNLFEMVRTCLTLALIAWLPTVLLGYTDWQYFYASQLLHPIIMKIALSGVLLLFLSISVVPRRGNLSPKVILILTALCLLTSGGIGFYGAELIYKKQIPGRGEHVLRNDGAALFTQYCSSCHLSDSSEKKVGVGLKDLTKRQTLPVSNQPATEKNIRKILKMGIQDMPAFPDLKDDEVDALIAYLKTL
jgi:uncharacterized membrane protein